MAKRFPRYRFQAKRYLAVVLNNRASKFNELEAAEEALELLLSGIEGNAYTEYISCFSAWQVARLSRTTDPFERAEVGERAHIMAERALETAISQDNRMVIDLTHEVLRLIESDFPELAVDLDAAAIGRRTSSQTARTFSDTEGRAM